MYPESDLQKYMQVALDLSVKALPQCRPNPPVGCVLVCDNEIISTGYTGEPGTKHAEAWALHKSVSSDRPFDAFVTLEPCSFHGRTPSCAKALIGAGVRSVYIGIIDPDPRNNGKGMDFLINAGVNVRLGILDDAIGRFLAPYLMKGN